MTEVAPLYPASVTSFLAFLSLASSCSPAIPLPLAMGVLGIPWVRMGAGCGKEEA